MTKQNKLIVGVVAVLVVYYFYDRNKKMKTVSDLKAGAEVKSDVTESGDIRLAGTGGIKLPQEDFRKKGQAEVTELNFAGKKGNSYFETIF